MFDSFVDAALYLRDDGVARIEIEHHIRAGTVIPSRYHYSSDAGADNWLRLCREPTYRHHIVTTEFWADSRGDGMAALVVDELGSETFDLISLGPGDGQKDAELVDSWLAAGADVMYYPYDVSLPLASRAVQRVRDRAMGQRGDRLRIKAVLADFHHFSTMRRVFDHRPAPNVVALLGSLGNLSREVAFLRDLRDTLTPNDLVVIEVRLKSPRGVPEMDSKSSLQFDFGPLDYYLGIPFEENLVSVQTKQGVSAVPNTDTVVVGCGEILYKGETFRDVPLQYIHLYEADAFIQTLESTGFTIVESIVDEPGAFLECVVRPRESLVRRITGWRLGA
jgi:hypothetical protein